MRRFLSGILALTGAVCQVQAQEPVSADAVADAEPQEAAEIAAEREELEPGVPTSALTAEVRRQDAGTGVMDELSLSRSEITGNQELPKVLYIVPWQKSDPGDLTGKPVNTLLDEVLAPVDRTEFMRHVDYYGDLYGKKEE